MIFSREQSGFQIIVNGFRGGYLRLGKMDLWSGGGTLDYDTGE